MRLYLVVTCLLNVGGDPPSSSLCNKGSSRATAQVPIVKTDKTAVE